MNTSPWKKLAGTAATITLCTGLSVLAVGSWNASADDSANASVFVPIEPERILDTRDPANIGLDGPFVSATPLTLQVTGAVPTPNGVKTVVPPGVTGVVLNVTPVNAQSDGFISVRPAGAAGPITTSSLNFEAGDIVPNAVVVALPNTELATLGQLEITYDAYGAAGPTTDLLVDVTGYMTSGPLQYLQFATELLLTERSLVNAFVDNNGVEATVQGSEVLTATLVAGQQVELEVFGVELHQSTHTVQVTPVIDAWPDGVDRTATVSFNGGKAYVAVYEAFANLVVDAPFSVTITPHGGNF